MTVAEMITVGGRVGVGASGADADAGAHAPSKPMMARSRIRIAFCISEKNWFSVGFI